MIILQPGNSNDIEIRSGEAFIAIKQSDECPTHGRPSGLSPYRDWSVTTTELYKATDGSVVWLAMCSLSGYQTAEWDAIELRQHDHDLSFYVVLDPEGAILQSGWRMKGDHPVGRLYRAVPTAHPTRMDEEPLPWVIDTVKTYRCDDDDVGAFYSAIHVCQAVFVGLPELVSA